VLRKYATSSNFEWHNLVNNSSQAVSIMPRSQLHLHSWKQFIALAMTSQHLSGYRSLL